MRGEAFCAGVSFALALAMLYVAHFVATSPAFEPCEEPLLEAFGEPSACLWCTDETCFYVASKRAGTRGWDDATAFGLVIASSAFSACSVASSLLGLRAHWAQAHLAQAPAVAPLKRPLLTPEDA